jgi:hypothetical protein
MQDFWKRVHDPDFFNFIPLISVLTEALDHDWFDPYGTALEESLRTLLKHLGVDTCRSAFKAKLLTKKESTFRDACYEIFAAARACTFLDPGSVELEAPIADPSKPRKHWKNSDVRGTFQGQIVRIEVTVLNEQPLQSVEMEFVDVIENLELHLGFRVNICGPLETEADLNECVELLAELHDHHVHTGGGNVALKGSNFTWEGGYYQGTGKRFDTVVFYPHNEVPTEMLRQVELPARMRRITPKYVAEDFQNPQGVRDGLDGVDMEGSPSKKIRDMIDGKLMQCEPGMINIVAFGNPQRQDEDYLLYALQGEPVGVSELKKTKNKPNQVTGRFGLARAPKAPFNPPEWQSVDDQETFIRPFEILSAVWHIRIGMKPLSKVFPNPNAIVKAPDELVAAIQQNA